MLEKIFGVKSENIKVALNFYQKTKGGRDRQLLQSILNKIQSDTRKYRRIKLNNEQREAYNRGANNFNNYAQGRIIETFNGKKLKVHKLPLYNLKLMY